MSHNPLLYYITPFDLQKPNRQLYKDVLQFKYSKKEKEFFLMQKIYTDFGRKLKDLNIRFLQQQINIEEVNAEAYAHVTWYKEQYPQLFPIGDFGAYTKKKLYHLYKQGKLSIDSFTIEDEYALRNNILASLIEQEEREANEQLMEADLLAKREEAYKNSFVQVELGMAFKSLDTLYDCVWAVIKGKYHTGAYKQKEAIDKFVKTTYDKKTGWVVRKIKEPFPVPKTSLYNA